MEKSSLVACLTNTVAANFTANCLLAIGAKPVMVEEPAEAEEIAGRADALLVNVGTLTALQREAQLRAVHAAEKANRPWVLDPVGVQALGYREGFVRELLRLKPTLVRCNREEAAYLESADAEIVALLQDLPMLVTGEVDEIRPWGKKVVGGDAMLQRVTATGCAQGAIAAAYLGFGWPVKVAAETASALMKRAGEVAAKRARTPGSFQIALLDALWSLTHD